MGKRKRGSAANDILELIALLPWWIAVILAMLSFLVLHQFAIRQIVNTGGLDQAGFFVTKTLWKSLAMVGQYFVPFFFLTGACISAWRQRGRKQLVQSVAHSKAADALDGVSWQQFEQLVGEAFRLQGYTVLEVGGGAADGGVDLVLRKDGEKFLVQCKQWKAYKVGVDIVRELYGVMAAKGATGGFVVTSGRFTEEAISFASGRNVHLLDGPKLRELIDRAMYADYSQAHRPAAVPSHVPFAESEAAHPACPRCGKPMVKRTAKRGPNSGGIFWGCPSYPACRGTLPIA